MRIEFARAAERDLGLIFNHLVDSYIDFGDSPGEAVARAETRLYGILEDAERIATAPYRGSSHDHILSGLRQLTLGPATYWFRVDETSQTIRVLAVFFGTQEQHRRMLIRLLGADQEKS